MERLDVEHWFTARGERGKAEPGLNQMEATPSVLPSRPNLAYNEELDLCGFINFDRSEHSFQSLLLTLAVSRVPKISQDLACMHFPLHMVPSTRTPSHELVSRYACVFLHFRSPTPIPKAPSLPLDRLDLLHCQHHICSRARPGPIP